jgi:hypothetical protein
MASFMTRVELHGVKHDSEIYDKLHVAMEKAGFSRQIQGSDGTVYHLPPAQYWASGNYTLEFVRDTAAKVSAGVWQNRAVLVTEGLSAWSGLINV